VYGLRRSGTRINCEISARLDLLDSIHSPSEPCLIILVNPLGCAARTNRPLEVGTRVRLEGLPVREVTARVVNCISVAGSGNLWLLGLALDEPGNVWGITTPPEDWHADLPIRPLILCLENNEFYLRLRKAALEQDGYSVIGVSTAQDALATLRDAPVCMVLAGHMLRGATGAALASKMKRIKPDVPVVLYSGKSDKLENVDAFINKDVSTHDFLVLVRGIVKRYFDAPRLDTGNA
jgi:CheY-like chemotaxis protein